MNIINMIRSYFSSQSTVCHKPNIILILLDQFRNDALGSHDIFRKLKEKGVFFSETITYAPYTLASCHATFTGLYGRDNGVDAYTKSNHYDQKRCFSIAQYLESVGYCTRAYTFSPILFPHAGFSTVTVIHEDDEPDILVSHKRELDSCQNQSKPFFSFLHYGEIHHEVVKNVIKKFSNDDDRYFSNLDDNKTKYREYAFQAGNYLESLYSYISSMESFDNTIVIIMTDHGASNGEKVGEKAYGTFTYDYSIKVWHYWIWPKVIQGGLEIASQVRTIDILPTLMELLDIKPKRSKKTITGSSLLPLIRGNKHDYVDRLAFCETGGVDGAYPSPNAPNIRCVRDGEWKLIQNTTTNQFELYNLFMDPEEKDNLYSIEQSIAEQLWKRMIEFI